MDTSPHCDILEVILSTKFTHISSIIHPALVSEVRQVNLSIIDYILNVWEFTVKEKSNTELSAMNKSYAGILKTLLCMYRGQRQ